MGHKTNPKILRLGYIIPHASKWYSKKNYSKFVEADHLTRKMIEKEWKDALVERIEIERGGKNLTLNITVAKPGVAIGRGGAGAEELKVKIAKIAGVLPQEVVLNVREVENPSTSAQVVVQQMVNDIERRMPFRRVMKTGIERIMKAGAKGVKVTMSGRLNGAEIARTETLAQGKVPLHTLRADIDYARKAAHTTYGAVGIKVWIYKGEVFI